MQKPLADKIRPKDLEDVVGQQHLLGDGKILNKIIKSGYIPNMIFYGPPGVGKTTIANIISNITNKRLFKINATNASIKDIKDIIQETNSLMNLNGILLYIDEIQNFNKKQQQSLLEFIENGSITLIASTTDNPYFYIYKAILSRCTVFEFKALNIEDIVKSLKRAIKILEADLDVAIQYDLDALEYIANSSCGDLRKSLNYLEIAVFSQGANNKINITLDYISKFIQNKSFNYDKDGDSHYDILSAFQKSIRGSDIDASIHYLARLIKSGDLISICRRLLVIASEDIGLAYPQAISIVKSCVDSAMQLGLPEARIPLAQATILLASSPKSNSSLTSIDKALYDLENKELGDIPLYLKDGHYDGAKNLGRMQGYKYPHNYNNHYVHQQYIPNNLIDERYYNPGKNKFEQKMIEYLKLIKSL